MQDLQLYLKKMDTCTRIFFILVILYIIFQIILFYKIQLFFPNGLHIDASSEDIYHPTAIKLLNHKIYGFEYQGEIIKTASRPPFYAFF